MFLFVKWRSSTPSRLSPVGRTGLRAGHTPTLLSRLEIPQWIGSFVVAFHWSVWLQSLLQKWQDIPVQQNKTSLETGMDATSHVWPVMGLPFEDTSRETTRKKSTKNSGKNQIYYLSRISNFNADRKYETVFSESY